MKKEIIFTHSRNSEGRSVVEMRIDGLAWGRFDTISDDSSRSRAPSGSRPIRVTVGTGQYDSSEMFASEITEEWKARFHGWCKCYHCPAGDGSMMQEITMALVEMSNGDMKYIEPTKIHFENNED